MKKSYSGHPNAVTVAYGKIELPGECPVCGADLNE
jgi:hypothetical protein